MSAVRFFARVTSRHLSSMFVFLSFSVFLSFYCDNIFSVGLLHRACVCINRSLHLLLFLLYFENQEDSGKNGRTLSEGI